MTPDVQQAMAAATALCRERGLQLSGIRQEILEHLYVSAAKPLTAYELLDRMAQQHGRRFGPPTAYRALAFLINLGLVSRIESRNAFVACAHPDHRHNCVFFVCGECGTSVEVENQTIDALIDRDAIGLGFHITRRVVELQGTCSPCRAAVAADSAPETTLRA